MCLSSAAKLIYLHGLFYWFATCIIELNGTARSHMACAGTVTLTVTAVGYDGGSTSQEIMADITFV